MKSKRINWKANEYRNSSIFLRNKSGIIKLSIKFSKYSGIILYILFFSLSAFYCNGTNEPFLMNYFEGQIESDFGTAIVKLDGSLWGNGPYLNGDFSIPASGGSESFTKINKIEKIVAIDLYAGINIAADYEGNIWYWGCNLLSSLMSPRIPEPQKISRLPNIKSIQFGRNKINLLTKNGLLWSVNLDPAKPAEFVNPARYSNFSNIKQISGKMLLLNDGTLIEYESTTYDTYGGFIPDLRHIEDFDNVFNRRTVILKRDGTVWAWGRNGLGELGNGSFKDSSTPVKVKELTDIIDISANYDFNLALKKDGTVWFWGFAGYDQNNKPFGYPTPFKIENTNNIITICAGLPCYLMKKDGSCWSFDQNSKSLMKILFI